MSFFARACVLALREFRVVNARDPRRRRRLQARRAPRHRGRDGARARRAGRRHAERMSFADSSARSAARRLARDGKLTPDDLAGGTFTISNGGVYGSLMSTPILNPPQSGILGMHKIEKRPVAIDDQVVIRR
jgi:2-oxoglutarate dehydrogenase E2 component (dihydrolipoamide succinyltransferase)